MTSSEQQPVSAAAAGVPPGVDIFALQAVAEDDYALGFECANPALQIERWGQDDASSLRQAF